MSESRIVVQVKHTTGNRETWLHRFILSFTWLLGATHSSQLSGFNLVNTCKCCASGTQMIWEKEPSIEKMPSIWVILFSVMIDVGGRMWEGPARCGHLYIGDPGLYKKKASWVILEDQASNQHSFVAPYSVPDSRFLSWVPFLTCSSDTLWLEHASQINPIIPKLVLVSIFFPQQ